MSEILIIACLGGIVVLTLLYLRNVGAGAGARPLGGRLAGALDRGAADLLPGAFLGGRAATRSARASAC